MANQRKSHVFRVTGLSKERPDGDLKTALQEVLDDSFTDAERSQIKAEITIVPSCYESDTQRAALVQFRGGVPQFLSELRMNLFGDWQIEMGDNDINFDCHFFGFTQLYAPDDNEPVVADIIAIAGLDGQAYGSWQGRGNLGRMWLRDFLSKDLPQCRTMIYGYNSKLSSHGVDTILDYGRELMEKIKKAWNTKELEQRPLIFIAHSFGGVILADCLVRAIQTTEGDHPAIASLYKATYDMLLFAIPHARRKNQSALGSVPIVSAVIRCEEIAGIAKESANKHKATSGYCLLRQMIINLFCSKYVRGITRTILNSKRKSWLSTHCHVNWFNMNQRVALTLRMNLHERHRMTQQAF